MGYRDLAIPIDVVGLVFFLLSISNYCAWTLPWMCTSCNSAQGMHHPWRPFSPSSSRAMQEEQTEAFWMGFIVVLLTLAGLSCNTELQNHRVVWELSPRREEDVTAPDFCWVLSSPSRVAVVHFFHVSTCAMWPPDSHGFSVPCAWVNIGFVHQVMNFQSLLPDWNLPTRTNVQMLFS